LIEKTLHLQERMDELEALQDALSPIPPEVLKELLEQGEVQITSMEAGDLSETSGLFMTDLEGREAQLREMLKRLEDLQREVGDLDRELLEAFGDLGPKEQAFFYDEWDHLMQDYRPEWCRLTETVLDGDDTSFVEDTRQRYTDLLNQVRRQFQLLKPELFRKIKRLMDGDEIDLDSVVEALVDRRAGNALSEKVYMRRDKRDREVAAVFLLDMSASTDDDAPEAPDTASGAEVAPIAPRQFDFSGFISEDDAWQPPKPQSGPPRRRVIDVEKEALILMAEALETLGDAYAVYGFSGYGRDQVDFFVAKEFSDPYNERTQGRIAAMKPHRSTRMGPAIRHAVRKLERQQARIKTLLMISDGYPQDYDYGKDRKSKDYGIQDTMMALREAQLKGIQTFCITVDPSGHDYLRDMCPDQQYLVIDDIAALPDELPKVYRGLTT
jgi:nitric oxide reductase NorD protein